MRFNFDSWWCWRYCCCCCFVVGSSRLKVNVLKFHAASATLWLWNRMRFYLILCLFLLFYCYFGCCLSAYVSFFTFSYVWYCQCFAFMALLSSCILYVITLVSLSSLIVGRNIKNRCIIYFVVVALFFPLCISLSSICSLSHSHSMGEYTASTCSSIHIQHLVFLVSVNIG